jgi:hypothetical protein
LSLYIRVSQPSYSATYSENTVLPRHLQSVLKLRRSPSGSEVEHRPRPQRNSVVL